MCFSLFRRIILFLYRKLFFILYSKGFRKLSHTSCLIYPDRIEGQQYIEIGNKVTIGRSAWLHAIKQGAVTPELVIGENCQLGRFIHIVSMSSVNIERNVLIADKVYISDNTHGYEDIDIPIMEQQIKFAGTVTIGENSWIGENVSLIGAKIGKHSIVGANSLVKGSFPDYSIIVGTPARIVKRYNSMTKKWEKTDSTGRFFSETT